MSATMELSFQELLDTDSSIAFHGDTDLLGKEVPAFSIDTRTLQAGEVYIALKGENHDGHAFVQSAFDKKATAAIVEQAFWQANKADLRDKAVFVVADTLAAMQAVAQAYRKKFDIPIIGLTGTNGKTSTKEMLAAVLAQAGRVCKTGGNLNNHIGVPLTLFTLNSSHDFAVIEMGMNHFGEIARLCEIAEPNNGLITNIGHGHTEFVHDLEGVAKAKMELFEYLRHNGWVFVNLDDAMIAKKSAGFTRRTTYGFTEAADVSAQNLGLNAAGQPTLRIEDTEITLNQVGQHNLSNALAAIAIGLKFGVSIRQCKVALESVRLPSKRMQLTRQHGVTILNDCYNANPESTLAALQTLAALPGRGRRIAVLGDMLELGARGQAKHEEIGSRLPEFGVSALFAHGPLSRHTVEACRKAAPAITAEHFKDKLKLAEALQDMIAPDDIILVKGSRGMKMEEVLEALNE